MILTAKQPAQSAAYRVYEAPFAVLLGCAIESAKHSEFPKNEIGAAKRIAIRLRWDRRESIQDVDKLACFVERFLKYALELESKKDLGSQHLNPDFVQ